ncbi:ubiquitin activation protein [Streptomyces spiroverticillatus]|uniref:Ubiquitin activation protein n=1 Tax=Streptomyces finlayi TaxID=67296 RepID=A0A918X090_9ACTN|nr:ThiF family adenylyltransferase [Streptomyces finlayi]GHA17918.1 ubiquitin activation protein [Streptomyces spiroverticillatus]GHC99655.1 ubiquitin activation protein [Streptomyces finlayi]
MNVFSAPDGAPWHVSAFRLDAGGQEQAEAVRRIRELRARILFDHGRRPDFRTTDGGYADDQDLDFGAWHFVGRREPDGPPLGYVRLSTPETGELFQTRAYLGSQVYEELLRECGFGTAETFEHSRLVVEHQARKLGLGVYLNAFAMAAARCLGAKAMIGTSGTADGQDRFHERFGFHAIPGTRRYVERYTEDVVIMLYRSALPAGEHAGLVEQLEDLFPAATVPAREAGLGGEFGRASDVCGQAPDVADRASDVREIRACGERLAAASARADDGAEPCWRPVHFELGRAEDRARLRELLDSGAVREVRDTIEDQLAELVTSREPRLRSSPEAVERAVAEQLGGAGRQEYGTWVWYPWSGRLVHLLPREEFRLVRTDRNRGRIDRAQQRRLLGCRVGVIGLSVGSSAALTFAMEGIGGSFRLADFDTLSVSNLNRLRAGVHHLGLNKCVLAARQMLELDPWLDIEIHPGGLTDETMEEFFSGGTGPLDLLVEECDTPYVKVAAREHARVLGIPVVMDANDRGLLDVERFDLEPQRPLLHGLLGDTTSRDLTDLTPQQAVDVILTMVDRERLSPELTAAVGQIGTTLSSWPQLASGVALGGALTAEAARRILLGLPRPSGRFYTDLEVLTSGDRSTVAPSLSVQEIS